MATFGNKRYGQTQWGQYDSSLKFLEPLSLKVISSSSAIANRERAFNALSLSAQTLLSADSRFVQVAERDELHSLSSLSSNSVRETPLPQFFDNAMSTISFGNIIKEKNIDDVLLVGKSKYADFNFDVFYVIMNYEHLTADSSLEADVVKLDDFSTQTTLSASATTEIDSESIEIKKIVSINAVLKSSAIMNAEAERLTFNFLPKSTLKGRSVAFTKRLNQVWAQAPSTLSVKSSTAIDFSIQTFENPFEIKGSTTIEAGFSIYRVMAPARMNNSASVHVDYMSTNYVAQSTELKSKSSIAGNLKVTHEVKSQNIYSGKSVLSVVNISKLGKVLYPIVYDKFDTHYDGFGLGILNNVMDFKISKKLNGPQALYMTLPKNDAMWEYIEAENFIRVRDDLFIIKSTEELRDDSGTLLSNIQAEHIQAELLDEYIERLFPEDYSMQEVMKQKRDEDGNIILVGTGEFKEVADIPDRTLQQYLDRLLAGTRFKAIARTVGGTSRAVIKDCNPVEAIQGLIDEFDCEYTCTGLPDDNGYFWLTFVDRVGAISGQQFRYRKNLTSIKRTTDTRNVVTVLHAYGKDGLKATITSPNVTMYRRPKHGKVELRSISDERNLYKYGQKYLELVDKPSVTYEATVLDLTAITDTIEADKVSIGDTVRVIDEELGIELDTRIFEYEEYPLEPQKTRIVFNNPIPSTEDLLEQVSKLFDHEGNLKEDVLLPLEEQFNLDDIFGDFGFEDGKFLLKDEFDEILFELSADEMKWFEDGEAKFEIGKDGLDLGNFKLSEDGMTIVDEFDDPIARFGKDGIGTTELTLGDLNDPSNQAKISLEGGEVIIRHSSYESYISIGRDIKIFAENKVYIDGGGV